MYTSRRRSVPTLAALLTATVLAAGCAASDLGHDDDPGPDAGTEPSVDVDAGPPPQSPDASATEPDAAVAPDAAPPASSLAPNQQALLDAINAERAAAGVAAVTVRADLLCAAQAHADDIGPASSCQINGTDGSTPEDRVTACTGPSLAATLVGCGYLSGSATAAGWAADAQIRAVVLDPQLVSIGVGENNRHWAAIFDR